MEDNALHNAKETSQPPSSKIRPGGRSARIRSAIMNATVDMLTERGIEGFNVAEIATRVGVPESTIYRRWRSREDLVVEVILTRMGNMIPLPDTGDFRSDIQAFLQASVTFLCSVDGVLLTRSMFSTMKQTHSQTRHSYWIARFSQADSIVERAIERGEIAPETDASVVMTVLIGALSMRLFVLEAPIDAPFLDQLAKMVFEGVMQSEKERAMR
jgi:AcrR family transcriptional regulator